MHAPQRNRQFTHVHGLDQIGVGAPFQAVQAVGQGAARGEHDDAHPGMAQAQPGGDGPAVLRGQAQVQHQQVAGVALQLIVQVAPVADQADREAGPG